MPSYWWGCFLSLTVGYAFCSLRLVRVSGTSKLTLGSPFRFKWQYYIQWEVFSVCVSQSVNFFKTDHTNHAGFGTLNSANRPFRQLKTWSEMSVMAQFSDKLWHLCLCLCQSCNTAWLMQQPEKAWLQARCHITVMVELLWLLSSFFVPLSVPEVSSTSSMQTNSCTSKVRWGEHFIANVAARFSGDWPDSWSSWNSSEVDTCMTHCWRAQFDQLDSHAVHNPTSMKTLSSTWWWLHH